MESIRIKDVRLGSPVCRTCGHETTGKTLRSTGGGCPSCRGDAFDVEVEVALALDAGEIAGRDASELANLFALGPLGAGVMEAIGGGHSDRNRSGAGRSSDSPREGASPPSRP